MNNLITGKDPLTKICDCENQPAFTRLKKTIEPVKTATKYMKHILFTLCAILIISCATPRKTRTDKSFNEISFGNSGGFTGYSDKYLIKGNREIFKIIKGGEIKINRISRIDVQKISNRINEIGFRDFHLTEKGNITYYLMVTTNKYSNKVTWSDETASPEIKNLYQILVKTLKPK